MFEPAFFFGLFTGSFVTGLLVFLWLTRLQSVSSDECLVVTSSKFPKVHFGPKKVFTFPGQHWQKANLGVRTIGVNLSGAEGVLSSDSVRFDLTMKFYVRLGADPYDVEAALRTLGPGRVHHPDELESFLLEIFTEACRAAASTFSHQDLPQFREQFRERVIAVCGTDLCGLVLEEAAVVTLALTPLEVLNPERLEDAKGIRVLREALALEQAATTRADIAIADSRSGLA